MRIFLLGLIFAAVLSGGRADAQTLPKSEVMAVTYGIGSDKGELKEALEMYRKGQYAVVINLIDRALLKGELSAYERSTAEFILTISRGKLMKEREIRTLNNYINSEKSDIYRDEARVIAANAYAELGDIEKVVWLIDDVTPDNLSEEGLGMYTFIRGYLELERGELEMAERSFSEAIDMECRKSNTARFYLAYIDYLNDDFDSAIKVYESLTSNPEFNAAYIYIMQIRYIQKDYNDVLATGEKALTKQLDSDMRGEAIRLMGEAYFNLHNYSDAIANIENYESMEGRMNRDLYYQLGYSYYVQGDYKKSIENFIKIVSGEDALAQNAYYHLADAYIKSGDKSGAMQAFSMAANFTFDDKMSEDALYNYAKLNYESAANNLYSNKIDLLQRYIDTYPRTTRTNELRGYLLSLYINGSNFDKAMNEFSKIKNPNNEIEAAIQRLCYQRGVDDFNNRYYKSAVSLFNKSLAHPVSQKYVALASFWKAEALYKQGVLSNEVIALYNKYLVLATPDMREYKMAQYNIAYIHFNNERWKDAASYFEKFTNNHKTRDGYREDALQRLGDAMFAQKEYSKAQQYYKNSAAVGVLNPDYAKYQQAMSEGLMGRDDMKVATLRSIAERSGNMRDNAALELAKTYTKLGKSTNGIKVLEQMIKRNGTAQLMPVALVELGVAYSNSGNETKALSTYKKVVKSYPQSSQAKDALSAIKAIYVAQGEAKAYISYIESLGGAGIDAGEKESLSFNALQRQFINGNHKRVIELANEYKRDYRKGVHSVDVQYYLVESMIIENHDGALAAAEELTNLPDNQYTLEVLQKTAQMYASNKEYAKQYKSLVRIYNLTTNPSKKREVLEALMLLAVSVLQDDAVSVESADMVLADKDATDKARDYAYYAKGRALYNSGSYSKAVTEIKKSKIPMSQAEGAQAKFLIADALYKLDDLSASEQVIIEMTSSDTPHQYWVARAFILYGDIYLKRGDTFQAKATYQSIIEGYGKSSDGIINSAKTRVSKIESSEDK